MSCEGRPKHSSPEGAAAWWTAGLRSGNKKVLLGVSAVVALGLLVCTAALYGVSVVVCGVLVVVCGTLVAVALGTGLRVCRAVL